MKHQHTQIHKSHTPPLVKSLSHVRPQRCATLTAFGKSPKLQILLVLPQHFDHPSRGSTHRRPRSRNQEEQAHLKMCHQDYGLRQIETRQQIIQKTVTTKAQISNQLSRRSTRLPRTAFPLKPPKFVAILATHHRQSLCFLHVETYSTHLPTVNLHSPTSYQEYAELQLGRICTLQPRKDLELHSETVEKQPQSFKTPLSCGLELPPITSFTQDRSKSRQVAPAPEDVGVHVIQNQGEPVSPSRSGLPPQTRNR